jgi:DNA-binding CsgD family transcriptional regulator
VQPGRFVVPYESDIDDGGRLSWAARPIIEHVSDDLESTGMALIVTDDKGRVLARREGQRSVAKRLDHIQLAPGFVYAETFVGTNAIGTAIARRGASVVRGPEHFSEALIAMACTAITVTDPTSGRVVGVVDLTSAVEDVNPLMLPFAKRVAWEIEQRLLEDASAQEHLLRARFLEATSRTSTPLIAISERTLLISEFAAGTIQPSDRERLWEEVLRGLNIGRRDWSQVNLQPGREVAIRGEPIMDGIRPIGGLVQVSPATAAGNKSVGEPSIAHESSVAGESSIARATRSGAWSTLTRTERIVAEHVAEGMTNAEVAYRLVVSPHTVDYHLRQLYRKLDVRSRVELTRLYLEHRAAEPLITPHPARPV